MVKSVDSVKSTPAYLFRANAVSAGGFLTRLKDKPVESNPNIVTTNGQSCLPLIGGVSRIKMEPELAFPDHIKYGTCETYAWGRIAKDVALTTIRASVVGVHLLNSPSSDDHVPDTASFTFEADAFAVEVESAHPQTGQPSFEVKSAEASGLSVVQTSNSGDQSRKPVVLEFDQDVLQLRTMEALENEFLTNQRFFDQYKQRLPNNRDLVYGKSKLPRTREGYHCGSIVKQIQYGDETIPGNTLVQPGLGTLSFGIIIIDDISHRISMAKIKMGSDAGGDVSFTGVETNGIWE